jgi:triosephosphate isomerase
MADTPSARRPLISGNWKMNLNHFEAIQTVQKLAYMVSKDDFERVDVSIHPPFTDIRSVQTVIDTDKMGFLLGAQHCHWDDKGAYTGEVSPAFLAKLGVRYVICGHSERRELFGETDEMVAKKVAAIQQHGMTPIMCVGETLAEREAGETETKVLGQVRAALAGRSAEQVGALVIAYEPIWAIALLPGDAVPEPATTANVGYTTCWVSLVFSVVKGRSAWPAPMPTAYSNASFEFHEIVRTSPVAPTALGSSGMAEFS